MRHPAPASVLVTAIVCMTLLETVAILKGVDGTFFAITMGLIGGAAGVSLSKIIGGRWPGWEKSPGEKKAG